MFHVNLPYIRRWLTIALACLLLMGLVAYSRIGVGRVIKVDAAYPTQTKPQSKLWHAQGHWWAWLPDGEGSSLWKRDADGWVRIRSLDAALRDIRGYADVWADDVAAAAVLAGESGLTVAQLNYDLQQQSYALDGSTTLPIDGSPVQSATITRDADGRWWIAYDHDGAIWARMSTERDASKWSAPVAISRGVDDDDLCVIFNMPDGVGVVWTDQVDDAVCFRLYDIKHPASGWSDVETLAQGPMTANNHLNAATASDGSVYIVTKTNHYVAGEPVLSLHARKPDGEWASTAYADWSEEMTPTRPIVLLTPNESDLKLVHTLLDNSTWNRHRIVCRVANGADMFPLDGQVGVIPARLDLRSATSCKQPLPPDAPWIVLASDRWGNVYEGELPASNEKSTCMGDMTHTR